MESTKKNSIFRETAVEKASSPERLSDYLRVTNAGVWVVLTAVLLLLAGLLVWASVGTLETTADARVIVENHVAYVALHSDAALEPGMTLRIGGQECTVASVTEDSFGRPVAIADTDLPNGSYDGVVVVGQKRPISFLFESS